jgi:hypothetical protein
MKPYYKRAAMIDQLKRCLKEIRGERIKVLESVPEWKGIEERNKMRDILILELPHSIDDINKVFSRSSLYLQHAVKREEKLKQSPQELILKWKKQGNNAEEAARVAFCDFLQQSGVQYYHYHEGTPQAYTIEEFSKLFPLAEVISCIERSSLNKEFKKKYILFAEDLFNYINKDMFFSPLIRKRYSGVSRSSLAQFFEYLEQRALKSSTIRAFEDLLLCRVIEYTPLPTKKLFSLGAPRGQIYEFEGHSFYVPTSFMKLHGLISASERLISRPFSENQLSKKIKRLGKYAGMSEKFNFSVLRNSIGSIQEELGIDPELSRLLSRR